MIPCRAMVMLVVCGVAMPAAAKDVLFQVDFENNSTGAYAVSGMNADFHHPAWSDGVDKGRAEIVAAPDRCGKALRINYPVGKVGEGVIIPVALERHDALYLAFDVYFPAGFTFVKEGKLPGLCGGACNSGGKKPDGRDGWSSRVIWRGDRASQYLYWPGQADIYGDMEPWTDIRLITGVWHHVETYVRMNHPGRADGISESWLDGRRVYLNRHIRWRDTADFAIDSFRFETFFGGSTPDFAPPADQFALFDNIVVSTRRSPKERDLCQTVKSK